MFLDLAFDSDLHSVFVFVFRLGFGFGCVSASGTEVGLGRRSSFR